jgi:hypothetical protein
MMGFGAKRTVLDFVNIGAFHIGELMGVQKLMNWHFWMLTVLRNLCLVRVAKDQSLTTHE